MTKSIQHAQGSTIYGEVSEEFTLLTGFIQSTENCTYQSITALEKLRLSSALVSLKNRAVKEPPQELSQLALKYLRPLIDQFKEKGLLPSDFNSLHIDEQQELVREKVSKNSEYTNALKEHKEHWLELVH